MTLMLKSYNIITMKKTYIKIGIKGFGSYITTREALPFSMNDALDCLMDMSDAGPIELTLIEMDEEKFENLPEFQGW